MYSWVGCALHKFKVFLSLSLSLSFSHRPYFLSFFLFFFYLHSHFYWPSHMTSTQQQKLGITFLFFSFFFLHVFPILNPPPSSLPIPSLWVVPVHQPQSSSIVHRTWTGDLFHIWYYIYFNAILPNHPTLSLSHRVQKTVLYISVSFAAQTLFSIKSPGNFECGEAWETSEQEPRLQTDINLEQEGGVWNPRKKGENCWGCLWACEMMHPLLGGRLSFLEEIQEEESLIKMCTVCDRA